MNAGSLLAVGPTDTVHRQDRPHRSCDALARLRSGQPVVIRVSENHSPRYDLVCSADHLTTEATAFLIRHTSGFVQVALRDERCDRLQLPPVAPGTDRMASQQCVGVDAATGIGTGISATDRTRTINVLGRPDAEPRELTRPGHVLPVRVSRDRGMHGDDTAAIALDLVERSGSIAAAFATLVGTGAHRTDLPQQREVEEFAARHGLLVIDRTEVGYTR
ncbi:3,4-dihydroxy-2-butanone-4-phosphate synthase [Gordonia sp. CPCC 206044]|uniref:3,4-dihydroxy-2-butanone-4-phosphate synthase n=1 Tax=Gordonia sp. CPCC 206044 TaxID=3140793 RepID=UPI003AF36A4A